MEDKTLHLIILEDNPDDAELIVRELEREGFTVEWKRVDTEEAFREALEKKPDLLLVDYKVPSFDGMAAISMQQQLVPEIPLIIVSGTIGEELAVECMRSGATDYVLKGRLFRLGPVVRRVLDEAEEHRKRGKAEEKLRQSEAKYRLLAENTMDCIWQMGLDLKFTYVNPSVLHMVGFTQEEWIGSLLSDHCSSEAMKFMAGLMIEELEKDLESLGVTFETVLFHKNGEKIAVEISSTILFDEDKNPVGFQGTTRDITDRKQAEEKIKHSLREKETLLAEIHHRVKNNMQIICSLLSLQSKEIDDERALSLIRNCEDRIRSMALAHEKLYLSEDMSRIDFSDYVEGLATRLFQVHRVDSRVVRFSSHIKDIFFNIETAIPLGLIVNELISNALKHAFPEGGKGSIAVKLTQNKKTEEYTLTVTDDGIGFPEGTDWRDAETFGLQLVDMLTEQLNGTMELDRSKGTSFKIIFKEQKYKRRI